MAIQQYTADQVRATSAPAVVPRSKGRAIDSPAVLH